MKTLPRFLPILLVGALALGGLAAVTSASGHSYDKRHSERTMCDKHGSSKYKKHGSYKHKFKHKRHGPDLAMKLSAMETKIGIRANQLDAWRDFTDALQATMKRPKRSKPSTDDAKDEPFALAERLADKAIARAEKAETLKSAIEGLRGALTPEQLEKVTEIEKKLRRKYAHWHGGRHGKGKPGKSDRGSDSAN